MVAQRKSSTVKRGLVKFKKKKNKEERMMNESKCVSLQSYFNSKDPRKG
jgi:hypothetical protein